MIFRTMGIIWRTTCYYAPGSEATLKQSATNSYKLNYYDNYLVKIGVLPLIHYMVRYIPLKIQR